MTDPTDYTPHITAIAEADRKRVAAKAEWGMARRAMATVALEEARASLASVGVNVGATVLTALARWDYRDRPVIVRFITCWSTPLEAPQDWQFQAHYVRATNAGQPFKGASNDWMNVVCAHPSEFGEALLSRMPLWGGRRMRGHNASPRPTEPKASTGERR